MAEKQFDNGSENIPLVYDAELNLINVTLLELPPDSVLRINLTVSSAVDALTQFVNISEFS